MRSRKLETLTPGMTESPQEHQQRAKVMENQLALSAIKESAIIGRPKVNVDCVDACSFRHDAKKRGASSRSSSPAPKSQMNKDGKSFSKRKIRPKDTVPRRKGARDRADMSFLVTARIHRVTCGIFQCAKVTSRIPGFKHGEKCSLLNKEADHPSRPKKGGGKGQVAIVRNAKNWGCKCLTNWLRYHVSV